MNFLTRLLAPERKPRTERRAERRRKKPASPQSKRKPPKRKSSDIKAERLGLTGPTQTMTITKPFCVPVRNVLTANVPGWINYHIVSEGRTKVSPIDAARQMAIEERVRENLKFGPGTRTVKTWLSLSCFAEVEVQTNQADLFTRLVENTGRMQVSLGGVNTAQNRTAADRYREKKGMPRWAKNNLRYEPGCKDGAEQWAEFQKAVLAAHEKSENGKKEVKKKQRRPWQRD